MKRSSVAMSEFAATIGLDWADAKHDICLQGAGVEGREFTVLEHRPESIAAWARALRQRFNGQPIAIALELDKGPIVYALRQLRIPAKLNIDSGRT